MSKNCENCDLNDNTGKMTCQWDGTWSETNFECLPGCGVPPSFRNGKMLGFINKKPPGYFEVGSELTYVCDWGYSMEVESFKLTCGENGDGAVEWVGGVGDEFDCKRNRPTMAGWRRRYG